MKTHDLTRRFLNYINLNICVASCILESEHEFQKWRFTIAHNVIKSLKAEKQLEFLVLKLKLNRFKISSSAKLGLPSRTVEIKLLSQKYYHKKYKCDLVCKRNLDT